MASTTPFYSMQTVGLSFICRSWIREMFIMQSIKDDRVFKNSIEVS